MRVLKAALLLAAFVGINANIRLPDPSWAVEVKPDPTSRRLLQTSTPAGLADEDTKDCKNKVFSCASCSVSRVCRPDESGSLFHYQDITCPDDRPYCDPASGTCLTTAPLSCGDTDNFICLEKNQFFPDADCKKFHYCDENYSPKLFKCIGDGMVYNADEKRCQSQVDANSCGKFDCDGNTLKKMKHTIYSRYYAMCKNEENAAGPLVVGVCPPYYRISVTSQVCEADCEAHGKGNIPDANDCTKYFSCTETQLVDGKVYIQKSPKSCPTGYAFDTSLFICVPNTNGNICPIQ